MTYSQSQVLVTVDEIWMKQLLYVNSTRDNIK